MLTLSFVFWWGRGGGGEKFTDLKSNPRKKMTLGYTWYVEIGSFWVSFLGDWYRVSYQTSCTSPRPFFVGDSVKEKKLYRDLGDATYRVVSKGGVIYIYICIHIYTHIYTYIYISINTYIYILYTYILWKHHDPQ